MTPYPQYTVIAKLSPKVGIDPMTTPEGLEPIRSGPGAQGERNRDYTHGWRENLHFLGGISYTATIHLTIHQDGSLCE